ncbi:VanZ family protein [Streptococcus pseudoporcinus]|uniref:VanZ family protein n=2 Tax=Streptococcus pseudoporcinus TaxID=361101 RepID=A0A4U9Z4W5_9STRE|nr:VanZ family protein [Streptococcus pseudoporcinus]VTS34459.1 VanZ family protein [Streptococcus pseudoporcinus]
MPWINNPLRVSKPLLYTIEILLILYAIAVAIMCFTPSPGLFSGMETPNMLYIGRLRLLLVPFNSIVGLNQVTSLNQAIWIFCQNALNILLLYPLVLFIHLLSSKWHSYGKSLLLGFSISLFIESSQLFLDLLINANRVFEIDDLWTNTLGALLAYLTYLLICKQMIKRG